VPRWTPTSLDDVRTLIADGTLKEGHWLDAKADLAKTTGAKEELARDLASFANDGGALLVGVREDKATETFSVDPIDLAGLPELVDQVARTRADPPLFTVCHPLVDPEIPGRGVLLVVIPPSASAPHMVDGRYHGRSDTTKYRMSDTEVARRHAVRTAQQVTANQLIDAEIARDPVPAGDRQLGHLYLVAQPLASPPDLATALIGSNELSEVVSSVTSRVTHQTEVNWGYLLHRQARANGAGFGSYGMLGRQFRPGFPDVREADVLDLEVDDDGRLALFAGGITRSGRAVLADSDLMMIRDQMVTELTNSFVTFAGLLGARTGYAGGWLLAVGLTGLNGKTSARANGSTIFLPLYSADRYVKGTEVRDARRCRLVCRSRRVSRRRGGGA